MGLEGGTVEPVSENDNTSMQGEHIISFRTYLIILAVSVQLLAFGPSTREKVAEGEYVMAFAEGQTEIEMHEEWTLWRVGGSGYEAQGTFRVRTSNARTGLDETSEVGIWAELLPNLEPFVVKLSPKTTDRDAAGQPVRPPMVLEFAEREIRKLEEVDGSRTLQATLTVDRPYAFYAPFSWFAASTAHKATRQSGATTELKVVVLDEDDPTNLYAVDGYVRFLGQEDVQVGGRKYTAHKFERGLGPEDQPLVMYIWTLPEGVLLAVEDGKNPQQRMELVRYVKYAEFGPPT
jgi:hypothetical protein